MLYQASRLAIGQVAKRLRGCVAAKSLMRNVTCLAAH